MPCWCSFRLKIKIPEVSRARLLSRKHSAIFHSAILSESRKRDRSGESVPKVKARSRKCLFSFFLSSFYVLAISSFSTRQQQGAGIETSLTDLCAAQTLLDVHCILSHLSQMEQHIRGGMISIDPISFPLQWSLQGMVGPEKAGALRRRISLCQDLSLHRAPWAMTLLSRKRPLLKCASGGRSRLCWIRKRRTGENKSSLLCSSSWTRSEFALCNRRVCKGLSVSRKKSTDGPCPSHQKAAIALAVGAQMERACCYRLSTSMCRATRSAHLRQRVPLRRFQTTRDSMRCMYHMRATHTHMMTSRYCRSSMLIDSTCCVICIPCLRASISGRWAATLGSKQTDERCAHTFHHFCVHTFQGRYLVMSK